MSASGILGPRGNVRLESAKRAKADIDRVAVHEIRYRANNDDHPLGMTPPIINATEDIRCTVSAIMKALTKPVHEIVGDTVRPED
jgi:hypothetical protein